MSQSESQQYTTIGRPRSSRATDAASSRFKGRLMAPGRCSSRYSASGSTSTSVAPSFMRRCTARRSASCAIEALPGAAQGGANPCLGRGVPAALSTEVQPAFQSVVGAPGGAGVDVDAIDAHRRRAQEARLLGLLVGDDREPLDVRPLVLAMRWMAGT